MIPLARSMSQLLTESAFDVLSRARALEAQGKDIVHLEIGEPDFETPAHVIEAGKRALDAGFTHYGPTPGLPEFREAIAEYVSATRGVPYKLQNVVVTPGGKPIIFFPMMALLEPGDEVIYPNPAFPIYESMIRYLGAKPVPVPLVEERGFSFDLDVFRSSLTDKTKMVVLNSPQNPTGGIIPAEDIAAIAAELRDRNVVVLSDEIYSRIVYDGPAPVSIASMPGMADKTIVLDGFSKTYAMTGWRLGYGVMPEYIANAVGKLMVNSTSCTATFTQKAGLAALRGPQDDVDRMVAEFRRRRDAFCAALNEVPGWRCEIPGGAFYAFANVKATGRNSKQMADELLAEAGVACLDGAGFGEYGKGYLRFSYANSYENLMKAVDRIKKFYSA
jgi:aspartate/methionine/tyrosine aminotransferase